MKCEYASVDIKYYSDIKRDIKRFVENYCTNSKFEDNTWFCDKLIRSVGEKVQSYRLYFSKIPEKYRDMVKYMVIININKGIKIGTLAPRIVYNTIFFSFINSNYEGLELKMINKLVINNFKNYIGNLKCSKKTKNAIWSAAYVFFKSLDGWPEMPKIMPISRNNPFKIKNDERIIEEKYIPDYVIKQLDIIFKDIRIPVYQRLIYWILRSVPSRVSEITSMKIDCLKPYKENWVVFIPTWKQAGGFKEPQIRNIHIKYEGHGKYLIDLIREQQEIVKNLQEKIREDWKGMLFVYENVSFNSKRYLIYGVMEYIKKGRFNITDSSTVMRFFNAICIRFNIKDKEGNIYYLTSHQLRHNGITDRLYAGFSTVQIRAMTGHQGDTMLLTSYNHLLPEEIIKKQQMILKETNEVDSSPIYFRGRILNMDERTEERLLKNPRAHRINKLGICSDFSGCKSKLFECLDCSFFIPDADQIDYYQEQVNIWSEKVKIFQNHEYIKQNAEYNLKLYTSMINRIKKIMEKNHENIT